MSSKAKNYMNIESYFGLKEIFCVIILKLYLKLADNCLFIKICYGLPSDRKDSKLIKERVNISGLLDESALDSS